jgi:putative addiction module killer protein
MDTIGLTEFEVVQTANFVLWLANLRDLRARIAIARRIERAAAGNLGDSKSVGGDVSEWRIDVGPGYRVYFTRRRGVLMVLLCAGSKGSQKADVVKAKKLAAELRDG